MSFQLFDSIVTASAMMAAGTFVVARQGQRVVAPFAADRLRAEFDRGKEAAREIRECRLMA
jgi:hypothetical protein